MEEDPHRGKSMDFLPLPDGLHEHELIPELRGVPYDNEGFVGYDQRQGWDLKRLRDGDIKGARADWNTYSQKCLSGYGESVHHFTGENLVQALVGPFIQNWIIGGLLQTALGRPITVEDVTLVRVDEQERTQRFLTLQNAFSEFLARKAELTNDISWAQAMLHLLDQASWILQDIDSLHDGLGAPLIPGMLAVALSALVNNLGDYTMIWCPSLARQHGASDRVRWLEYKLVDQGWCPERIHRLRVELNPEGLYFASLLEVTEDRKDHDVCSESICIAYNVDEKETYKQRHEDRFCECRQPSCAHDTADCMCKVQYDIRSVADKVISAVSSGRIPVLTACRTGEAVSLDVSDIQDEEPYVAISHVWSDGLGNPNQNVLRPCLILYLDECVQYLLKALKPGAPSRFWIDTICVPIAPDSARKAAIKDMRRVYTQATAVLAITQELTTRHLPVSLQETIVRICQTKWFGRLWTMQEGVLAQTLAFQYGNHAVDSHYLDDRIHNELLSINQYSAMIGSRANLMMSNLITVNGDSASREDLFVSLWFNMRHRTSSELSDQAICAAVFCDIDPGPVLAAERADRMQTFWKSCKYVPSGIIWVNGPRFDVDGLRWAPRSLLHESTWAIPLKRTGQTATVLSDGLHLSQIQGYSLPDVELPAAEDSLLYINVGKYLTQYAILLTEQVDNPSWNALQPLWKSICLIVDTLPDHADVAYGALVSCVDYANDRGTITSRPSIPLRARWLAQVNIVSAESEWAHGLSRSAVSYEQGEAMPRHHRSVAVYAPAVQPFSQSQEWCIW